MQKNVLILGEDQGFNEFLALILEGEFQLNILEVSEFSKALDLINKVSHELIAIINLSEVDNILENQLYTANKKNLKLPFIQIIDAENIDPTQYDDFFKDNKYNFILPKENIHKEILGVCEKIEHRFDLKDSRVDLKTKDGTPLFRIKINRYLQQKKAQSDIYIKIGSGKFIKLIRANEDIDKKKILEYAKKGQKYLFQAKDDYEQAVNKSIDKLVEKFGKTNLSTAEHLGLQLASIKEVQDVVRNMGISDRVIDATDGVIQSVEEVLKKAKSLKSLVKNLLSLKSSFFTRTSIMNYLLGGMCEQVDWTSHKTFKKLIYASIYCDFGFEPDEDSLATILSFEDQRIEHLTSFEKKKVRNHPRLSAAILEKSVNFLTDEVSLILQHHEKPDGTGFPQGLNYKTTPLLSCLFILAYDYTTMLVLSCSKADDIDPITIFKALPEGYRKGNYEKPYIALKKVLKITT